jgi:SAM-dependent methyltransferase
VEAAERWRRLVSERREADRVLGSKDDPATASFWDGRSANYAAVSSQALHDPLVARIGRSVGPDTTVLDVGAGTGRITLPLAARAREVTAVDPSPGMLGELRRAAEESGVTNVTTLEGRWEDVDPPEADVTICAHVLPMIEDASGFLAKLDRATGRRAFVCLRATGLDYLSDPLWRHFHGSSRRAGPSYLDGVAVLEELGISPTVHMIEVPLMARFDDLDAAASFYGRALMIEREEERERELRKLLSSWLVRRAGRLYPPARRVPAALLTWRARRR